MLKEILSKYYKIILYYLKNIYYKKLKLEWNFLNNFKYFQLIDRWLSTLVVH